MGLNWPVKLIVDYLDAVLEREGVFLLRPDRLFPVGHEYDCVAALEDFEVPEHERAIIEHLLVRDASDGAVQEGRVEVGGDDRPPLLPVLDGDLFGCPDIFHDAVKSPGPVGAGYVDELHLFPPYPWYIFPSAKKRWWKMRTTV